MTFYNVIHKHENENIVACSMADLEEQIYNEVLVGNLEDHLDPSEHFLTAEEMQNCVTTDHLVSKHKLQTILNRAVADEAKLHFQVTDYRNVGRLLEYITVLTGRVQIFSCNHFSRSLEKTLQTLLDQGRGVQYMRIRNVQLDKLPFWMDFLFLCEEVELVGDFKQSLEVHEAGAIKMIQMFVTLCKKLKKKEDKHHRLKCECDFNSPKVRAYLKEFGFQLATPGQIKKREEAMGSTPATCTFS
ncbi:hypothetical protein L596_017929 [Steinernema carpocapsae]|uniref:Uncharacterized protein n=1 Tax=Steinernema carpocapsae TaxID=34508 RepID=A0A4U5N3X9_STECR|nr:hypothetical protein L596_017929 [Steinernema carpocapsae]